MAKYANFIEKPKEDLTKEDLRSMVRCVERKRIPVKEMMEYYEIELEDYYEFMKDRGLYLTSRERNQLLSLRSKVERKKNPPLKDMFKERYQLPDYVLCSLYNIDFEYIDGKFYYDELQLSRAREDSHLKILGYEERKQQAKTKKSDKDEYTDLTTSDLIAMRYYRGVSRGKMASKILGTVREVAQMESEMPITKETANLYKDELKIKNHHIKQLRKIMKGEAKEIHDDRTIPKEIKVGVWKKDKGKCSNCGNKEKLHYHHIEEFADGGQNTIKNLTLLCVSCHAEVHKDNKAYHMLKAMAKG